MAHHWARRSFLTAAAFFFPIASPLFVMTTATTPLLGQIVPPEVANSRNSAECVVNADNVYVRSGAGENYYPTMKLSKGTKLTVIGEKFDWLKIVPPEGSFSFVGKHYVEKTGEGVGKV